MKKIFTIALSIMILLFATACGNNISSTETNTAQPKETTHPKEAAQSKKTSQPNDHTQSLSVSELMDLATKETDSNKRIKYAEMACEKAGIEPKILTDKEFSSLQNRINAIDATVENLSKNKDSESINKIITLKKEQLNSIILRFYNQAIRMND